jgi:porin
MAELGVANRNARRRTLSWGGALALAASATTAAAQEQPALGLSAVYTGEGWRNVKGGVRRGSTYLGNLEAAAELDADRALQWPGVRFRVSGFHNNEHTPPSALVGDLQSVSNRDAKGGTRLYEAWVEKDFGRGRAKVGVLDLNTEFSLNATGAVLINGAQGIGLDVSQVGKRGASLYPATGLGVVGSAQLASPWTVTLGAFGAALPAGGPRSVFSMWPGHGAFLIAEASRQTPGGGHLALGLWGHTAKFAEISDGDRAGYAHGGYALLEWPVLQGDSRQLNVFMRLGAADGDTQQIAAHFSAGAVVARPFLGREGEALAFGVAVAENGAEFRRAERLRGRAVERRETALELTYRVDLTPWLAVQPDLQYVINPGADPTRKDALVVGVRFQATWRNFD